MEKEIIMELIKQAKEIANRNFCCKHSNFTVGAALMTQDGKVYKGFNVENDGIQSICAERVAFTKALSEGNKDFVCVAVVGKPLNQNQFNKTLPCGYCRQFLSEYATKDFIIYTYDDTEDKLYTYTLKDLLPESFSL
ncbi:MAG: cytidine deaminase [Firmicutes bacterium]|nr:cytidine deaminase [Bacillota bacterium]